MPKKVLRLPPSSYFTKSQEEELRRIFGADVEVSYPHKKFFQYWHYGDHMKRVKKFFEWAGLPDAIEVGMEVDLYDLIEMTGEGGLGIPVIRAVDTPWQDEGVTSGGAKVSRKYFSHYEEVLGVTIHTKRL